MLYGQMSLPKLSEVSDYLQLDICGLNTEESLMRYIRYKKTIPVILHGDWTKKGFSENNIEVRYKDYINIINSLNKVTEIKGITIHPPSRKKIPFEMFLEYCREISKSTGCPVFIENRSSNKLWLSQPDEIIDFSKEKLMTIDMPQLFICCGRSQDVFYNCLKNIEWENVKELHLGNVEKNVARKLDDGLIDYSQVFKIINKKDFYCTFEILGGVNTFQNELIKFKNYINQ